MFLSKLLKLGKIFNFRMILAHFIQELSEFVNCFCGIPYRAINLLFTGFVGILQRSSLHFLASLSKLINRIFQLIPPMGLNAVFHSLGKIAEIFFNLSKLVASLIHGFKSPFGDFFLSQLSFGLMHLGLRLVDISDCLFDGLLEV